MVMAMEVQRATMLAASLLVRQAASRSWMEARAKLSMPGMRRVRRLEVFICLLSGVKECVERDFLVSKVLLGAGDYVLVGWDYIREFIKDIWVIKIMMPILTLQLHRRFDLHELSSLLSRQIEPATTGRVLILFRT